MKNIKIKKDGLINHVIIAIRPLRCSDCHKIIWPTSPYIIGQMPYVEPKKLCIKCAHNYKLEESKSYKGGYFLERINKND